MKIIIHPLSVLALSLAAGASLAWSADLGIPAPPLQIREWIKGGPVNVAAGQGKTLYVIEFWATWCPPCRTSIPHLTELQKKFKDKGVVIVGLSDETADKVKPFVERMGETMDYVVALDKENMTSEAYMKAFEQNGIPHAFIVDKEGRVAWHGHPMAGLEQALDQLVTGKFDIEAAKKAAKAEKSMAEYFQMASADPLDERASGLGQKIVEDSASNPGALNEFAWVILTHPRIKHRDLPLALKAAKAAHEATGGKDAAITDTYARALFDSGKRDLAITRQKEAIAACKDDQMRGQLEKTLKDYEAKVR